MKNLILLFAVAFIASCSPTYTQVYEIKSQSTKTDLQTGFIVYENDTLKIAYDFHAEKGMITFVVFNKTDKPLFVDWKKSAAIYNENKIPYWEDQVTTKTAGGSFYYRPSNNSQSVFNRVNLASHYGVSVQTKSERITAVPPQAKHFMGVYNTFPEITYPNKPYNDTSVSISVDYPAGGSKQSVAYYKRYTAIESPVKFSNFLALSFSENFTNEFYISNAFYVSDIVEIPTEFYKYNFKGKDQYPHAKHSNYILNAPEAKSMAKDVKQCEHVYSTGGRCGLDKKDGNYCLTHKEKK